LNRKLTARLSLEALEDRTVLTGPISAFPSGGSTSLAQSALVNGQLETVPLTTSITTITPPPPIVHNLAVGYVNVFQDGLRVRFFQSPSQFQDFQAYDAPGRNLSTLHVVVGDVTGDGVPDVITGPGSTTLLGTMSPAPALPVKIFDGATLGQATPRVVRSFQPFGSSFTGGLYVTVADFDRDGKADVVVSRDLGGTGRVMIFSGADLVNASIATANLTPMADFDGIADPMFMGGCSCAAGDLNGDGVPDLVVGANRTGGPRVAGFDGVSLRRGQTPRNIFHDFFAFNPGNGAGVLLAIADVNHDGHNDLLVTLQSGVPQMVAFDGTILLSGTAAPPALWSQTYGPATSNGGLRVVAKDLDGNGTTDFAFSEADSLTVTTVPSKNMRADGSIVFPGLLDGPAGAPLGLWVG
jgi:hypothetical protein